MNPLEVFEKLELNTELLQKSSRNHERRKYVRDHIMTKALLTYLINDCNFTSNHIATEIFGKKNYIVDAGTIIDKCKFFGIKTNTIKDSANNLDVRKKCVTTCFKKYGAINPLSKGTKIFKKRNRTIKRKYGVENVFQVNSVKLKSKKTLKEKYGVNNPIELPSYERNNGRKSKLQLKIEKLLETNKVPFKSEVSRIFGKYNKKLNKFYSPIVDILVESKKIVIEVNGDFWHGNPKIYNAKDKIKKWGGNITASKIWELDKIRQKQIESFGYKVVVLWELDIRKNIEKIEKTLKLKLL